MPRHSALPSPSGWAEAFGAAHHSLEAPHQLRHSTGMCQTGVGLCDWVGSLHRPLLSLMGWDKAELPESKMML